MIHTFREARLLSKQMGHGETSNEDLLKAVDPTDNLSPREKLDLKFKEDANSATNRIKGTETKWTTWLGSRLSSEEASQKSVDDAITKIAKERATSARGRIAGFVQRAEQTLFDKSVNASNSLTILETKQRVCDEVIKDLQEEIEVKTDLRNRYEAALGEVAKLKGKHTDVPSLKKIEMKLKLVEGVRVATEQKIAERMADENIARTGRTHDNLKSFLINANPALALTLDRMLLDNAAGENDNLLKAIDALTSVDKTERAMLRDLAKHLKLSKFGWENNRAIREFYQSKVSANETLNPPKLNERLKALYDQAPIGQGIAMKLDGASNVFFGIVRKNADKGRKVVLVDARGRQNAVIDITRKVFTMRTGPNEFTHFALEDTPITGGQIDPTKMRFNAKKTEVNLHTAA
ncbi:MAG: hypothetical protein KBC47_03730 [Candidatus Peribacteraceae bacterium]|nr:hypothetical protein [Candidatus Peribacteraceae bacterium]